MRFSASRRFRRSARKPIGSPASRWRPKCASGSAGPPRWRSSTAAGARWNGILEEAIMTEGTTTGTLRLKTGLAEMLKGGVIMDVTDAAQARIAEDAGAVAVMALERVPADIRKEGGVARMADPTVIEAIMGAVSVPVMAKCPHGPC